MIGRLSVCLVLCTLFATLGMAHIMYRVHRKWYMFFLSRSSAPYSTCLCIATLSAFSVVCSHFSRHPYTSVTSAPVSLFLSLPPHSSRSSHHPTPPSPLTTPLLPLLSPPLSSLSSRPHSPPSPLTPTLLPLLSPPLSSPSPLPSE